MKGLLVGLGVIVLAVVGLWLRSTVATSDVALDVGPATTVISGPLLPNGQVDFDAAMGASPASEQRMASLLALLSEDPEASAECAPVAPPLRTKLLAALSEPLRMTHPASHITEASEQLAPRLMLLLRRVLCSCSAQNALEGGQLLATLSAYLSSSNQDTFYQLHPLAARAANGCFRAAPADAPRGTEALHFYDVIEHLELVRLGMLEEIVRRHDAKYDVNAALVAFNDAFMQAAQGAQLQEELPPPAWRGFFRSAAQNRAEKSAAIGRSHAQQVPEILAATRTAHEITLSERRSWAGQ